MVLVDYGDYFYFGYFGIELIDELIVVVLVENLVIFDVV